ncbi:hypothetical protein C8J56DRAFT_882106 [Mycena floridula]|nr:hypothetical protein C8J56DRAFT_882106 [Mycena floridula]
MGKAGAGAGRDEQIRKTSIRRQYFSAVLQTLKEKNLQLLCDVDTRWSSTLLMVKRTILLCKAITLFHRKEDFAELRSYMLDDDEWDDLEFYRHILSLRISIKVPHAFQQKLSAEKKPTLCNALPAYEAMVKVWKEMQDEIPQISSHRSWTGEVGILDWIRKHQPRWLSSAKDMLLRELAKYHEPGASNTLARPRNSKSWADDILGLNSGGHSSHLSLWDELDTYLQDNQQFLTILAF